MKIEKVHWFGIVAGVAVGVGSLFLFWGSRLSYFLIVIALLIMAFPFGISFLVGQSRQKEKEEKFLEFVRDLVENVRSGTSVGKSIVNLKGRNYGTLSPHVDKLANQLSMGIVLTDAFSIFSKEAKSRVIARAVGLINEAERAGGRIDVILDSVARSVNQIEQLKQERKAAISNLVTQGYLIFLVFIVIMLVLEFKILPLVSDLQGTGGLSVGVTSVSSDQFSMPLFIMLLVQSFFAGLVIGKISEGSVKAGFKHSFILVALTLLVTTGARVLFG